MSISGPVSLVSRPVNRTRAGRLLWLLFVATGWWGALSGRAADAAAKPAAPAPAPNSDASCLECHSDTELSIKKDGKKISLFIDEKIPARSAHRSLNCIDCHEKFDGEATPHRKPMVAVDCTSCHENLGKKHQFHPRIGLAEIPAGEDTSCVACHGKHDTVAVKQPAFVFADGPQPQACGKCHEAARDHFLTSAHGRAFKAKQVGAPDCLTCHREPVVPAAK